jgi:hypothetical protein
VADSFRPVFEGLQRVAESLMQGNRSLIQANEHLVQAGEGLKAVAQAAFTAKDEHEDLRETVHRLESLVIAQGHDLRAMRDRLDRGDR